MKKLSQWIGLTLASLFLGACASHQPATNHPENKTQTAKSRQVDLATIKNWYVKGSIGVKNEQDAWSASIYWKLRNKNNYTLQLFGPAGMGTLKIVSAGNKVTLTNNKNETFNAPSSETLLEQQTGWYLPLSNMYYWVRGIAVPNMPAKTTYDQYHHLTTLEQQGWDIQYLRYTSVDGVDLPSKIFMTYQKLGVKIVISSWQLPKLG